MSNERKFDLGQVMATPNALGQLTRADVLRALARHAVGDWGDVVLEDGNANNQALATGARLLSVYHSETGLKFWIITEADRSVTTVLLPEDY